MRFTKNFHQIARLKSRIKILQGSQGAAKTYSALLRWIILAVRSKNTQHCTIVTDTFPNLETGAIKDFIAICDKEGIEYRKKEKPYRVKINKWTFEFFGVDNEVKGLGGRRDRLYINEGIRIEWAIARQLIARSHVEVIVDFNASRRFWAHEQFVETGLCDFLQLTYSGNECLPEAERESIERHAPWGAVPDENYWRVYGLGEIGFVQGAIFKDAKRFKDLPPGIKVQRMTGVDFGWNDELTAVTVYIDRKNKHLYWKEIFYASEAEYDDFSKAIKANPASRGTTLICDHSPRDIRELMKRGHKAMQCDKRSGITSDIRRLKQYTIFVHEESKNLIRETGLYKWQQKGEDILDYPVDKDNHSIDAARYASIVLMNIV